VFITEECVPSVGADFHRREAVALSRERVIMMHTLVFVAASYWVECFDFHGLNIAQ
jgi:hypothetical protein